MPPIIRTRSGTPRLESMGVRRHDRTADLANYAGLGGIDKALLDKIEKALNELEDLVNQLLSL